MNIEPTSGPHGLTLSQQQYHTTKYLQELVLSQTLNWNPGIDRPEDALSQTCYLVTMVFNRDQIRSRKQGLGLHQRQPDLEFKAFWKLYLDARTAAVGYNWNRPNHRSQHPLGIGVLDYEGTKWQPQGGHTGYCNPHIHGLLLFHPETQEKAARWVAEAKGRARDGWLGLDAIELEPFDPSEPRGLWSWLSYATKTIKAKPADDLDGLAFRIYPMPGSGKKNEKTSEAQ